VCKKPIRVIYLTEEVSRQLWGLIEFEGRQTSLSREMSSLPYIVIDEKAPLFMFAREKKPLSLESINTV